MAYELTELGKLFFTVSFYAVAAYFRFYFLFLVFPLSVRWKDQLGSWSSFSAFPQPVYLAMGWCATIRVLPVLMIFGAHHRWAGGGQVAPLGGNPAHRRLIDSCVLTCSDSSDKAHGPGHKHMGVSSREAAHFTVGAGGPWGYRCSRCTDLAVRSRTSTAPTLPSLQERLDTTPGHPHKIAVPIRFFHFISIVPNTGRRHRPEPRQCSQCSFR